MNKHILDKSQEKTDKIDNNKPSCSICGSKRQRNLVTKKHLFLKPGTIEYETRCKRCWKAYELLGNGKDRVHTEGSQNTSKPAYRYYSVAQADRVGKIP